MMDLLIDRSFDEMSRCAQWRSRGGGRGISARGQIYMGAPVGVVEIHLRAKSPPL